MRYLVIVLLTFLGCTALLAQDPSVAPSVSSALTPQEIANLLTSQNITVEDATCQIVSQGDAAVDGLCVLLASNQILGISGDLPNKTIVATALEAIGTSRALQALVPVADSSGDIELRAVALEALVKSYYPRVLSDRLTPSKDAVCAFFANAGDTSYVGFLQKHVDEISQEGLVAWLGLDFGDPAFADARQKAGANGDELPASEYAKLWWRGNADKVAWNQQTGHFESPR